MSDAAARSLREGFTLIELSIVLVIIGLLVGGVLVGRDLIVAAQVRQQISQIEKYNTAVHTFQLKYNCLPGDCKNAADFGFPARGPNPGEGDGDGVLQGIGANGGQEGAGELVMFWVDLSMAGLINEQYNTASSTVLPGGIITPSSTPSVDAFFPKANIGQGNYVYVWSGGIGNGTQWAPASIFNDGKNYFGIQAVGFVQNGEMLGVNEGLGVSIPVWQAYNIDQKIDDGIPFSGKVTAMLLNGGPRYALTTNQYWVDINYCVYQPGYVGTGFYNMAGANNGTAPVCALSFEFQ